MDWLWLLLGLAVVWPVGRRLLRARRERFIRNYTFHAAVGKALSERRPELDESQRQQVLAALRDYFVLCLHSRQMVAMPSQVVDDAWHAFILYTRAYELFCRRAFGRFLHHTPAEAYPASLDGLAMLRHTWALACAQEGLNVEAAEHLPRLFAIDRDLAIHDGYYYLLDCTGQRVDEQGHEQFCAAALARSAPRLSPSSPSSGKSEGGGGCTGSCGGGCGGD